MSQPNRVPLVTGPSALFPATATIESLKASLASPRGPRGQIGISGAPGRRGPMGHRGPRGADNGGVAVQVIETNDATVTTLYTYALAANAAATMRFTVVAKQSAGSPTAAWTMVAHVVNAAGVYEVVSVDKLAEIATAAAGSWDATVIADDEGIKITVAGAANTDVKWFLSQLVVTELGTEAGASYSDEATQYLSRLPDAVDDARKEALATLIDSLVDAGIWAKLDQLYVCNTTENNSFVNLVQNLKPASIVNLTTPSITFTADRGWANTLAGTGNNFVAAEFILDKFTQDSASLFVWAWGAGSAAATSSVALHSLATSNLSLSLYSATNRTGGRMHHASPNSLAVDPISNGTGLVTGVRSGSTATEYYHNDQLVVSGTTPSVAIVDTAMLGAYSVDRPTAAFGAGGALTAPDVAALYNALHAYMTAVGNT